jgi:hypothetical protein
LTFAGIKRLLLLLILQKKGENISVKFAVFCYFCAIQDTGAKKKAWRLLFIKEPKTLNAS